MSVGRARDILKTQRSLSSGLVRLTVHSYLRAPEADEPCPPSTLELVAVNLSFTY